MKLETTDLLVRAAADYDVPPYYMVDNVLPVHLSARRASAVPSAYLKVVPGTSDYDGACRALEDSGRGQKMSGLGSLGINVASAVEPLYTSGDLAGAFYFFKGDGAPLAEIRELFRRAHDSIKRGEYSEDYLKGLRLTGEFLEYPRCCVERYARDRADGMRILAEAGKIGRQDARLDEPIESEPGSGFVELREDVFVRASGMAEKRAKAQMEALTGSSSDADFARAIGSMPMDAFLAYHTLAAYPCDPTCESSRRMGTAAVRSMGLFDAGIARIYENIILPSNTVFVWNPNPQIMADDNLHILQLVAKYQRAHAYEISRRTAIAASKTGRNEPCPCDSGKKFKKCCGGH